MHNTSAEPPAMKHFLSGSKQLNKEKGKRIFFLKKEAHLVSRPASDKFFPIRRQRCRCDVLFFV
jgi:hypothetical protein